MQPQPAGFVRSQREVRIVIPAYCEEGRIARCVVDYCSHFGGRASVVVVANGCRDRTAEIVRSLIRRYDNLSLIEIEHAIGKGGAVRVGLMSGSEPFVGYSDADGSTSAIEFDALLETCNRQGTDGAIGSRWIRGANVTRKQPLLRRISSRAFNLVVRLVFKLPYSDTQCGAKLFRRDAIDSAIGELELANFAFDIDLLYALKRLGFKVVECPITWEDYPHDTKIRLVHSSCTMLLAVLRLRLRHGALRKMPYGDLIARSAVIPVKQSLTIAVASDSPRDVAANSVDAELVRWVLAWESQGHTVRWMAPQNWWEVAQAVLWYVRRGHAEVDALVAHGSKLYPFIRFSSKPKVCMAFDRSGSGELRMHRLGLGPAHRAEFAALVLERVTLGGMPLRRFYASSGGWNIALPAEGAYAETRLALSLDAASDVKG